MLHQPMEPEHLREAHFEPGTLHRAMPAHEFHSTLTAAVNAIPEIRGMSNHTGSLLTADEGAMRQLMTRLRTTGLYFLDSRTTPRTVAHRTARQHDVPTIGRDIFLDHEPTEAHVRQQFDRALRIMQRRGRVVVIGHPHDVTLEFLSEKVATLPQTTRRRLVRYCSAD